MGRIFLEDLRRTIRYGVPGLMFYIKSWVTLDTDLVMVALSEIYQLDQHVTIYHDVIRLQI